ncbi:serine/threonine protein kinase [Streptomyces sp. NPDC056921]|uniref:serine/threonine protein kinase n=1 Tax=Streptomyces sp. NPDC056921 TaxID=3345966 RepID=UPI0036395A2F
MPKAAFRFTALQAADPVELGDFRPVARLGEGGMGQVFIAFSPGGQPAAVKVIRPEFARDAEFGRRFEREVRAAQKVRGAHLAPLLDADPHAEQPWLATGFVAGPTLRDLVAERGALPASQVLLLAWGIAHALADIHAAKVVHRDLKPGNIMLDETGPKVIDFGIVKSLTQSVTYSSHSTRVGTPLYMSPEQAMGRAVGAPSDIFALGSTLYFLATGQEAFGAENEWGVAHRIVADDPDLSAIRSAPLRDLLTACLDKEPGERPAAQQILELCERELGDDLGPGSWMRIDGARAAIQERTAALRGLTRYDDDPASAVTVPRPRNLPKTRLAEPDPPAVKPPEPEEPAAKARSRVVTVHVVKMLVAGAVLLWAMSRPVITQTWHAKDPGKAVSRSVSEYFDWHHPWASTSNVVTIGVFGTLVAIICLAVYLVALCSEFYEVEWYFWPVFSTFIFIRIWGWVVMVAAILLIVRMAFLSEESGIYELRTALASGAWLLLLANGIVVEALIRSARWLDPPVKASATTRS